MKRLVLIFTIVIGLSMTTFANPNGGGLFQRGEQPRETGDGGVFTTPGLPSHGQTGNQDAPLGTGIAVLATLGAAYLVGKKCNKE